ncbi:MAG: shikimate dehydrogenase [Campylobacterales bacterium]|nr:shikimate dehydrogenase [Campylobacterales bacterium]
MSELFAIFGHPVAHSRSPLMYNHLFDSLHVKACYTRIDLLEGSRLKERFLSLGLSGANVTFPHKEAAFEACDEVRGLAQSIGAVNTIVHEDGRLIGYNTDADGFWYALRHVHHRQNILMLGAGGTAKALAMRLSQEGCAVTMLNRSKGRLRFFEEAGFACFDWESFTPRPYDLIINTTSAGLTDMHYPAPLALLEPTMAQAGHCIDVIYGKETPFLKRSKAMNKAVMDGSEMLLSQGVLAAEYFTQGRFERAVIETIMRESFAF